MNQRLVYVVGPSGAGKDSLLAWLREHAPRAGLVCTMAANNETGVISDLDGIAAALTGSPALYNAGAPARPAYAYAAPRG